MRIARTKTMPSIQIWQERLEEGEFVIITKDRIKGISPGKYNPRMARTIARILEQFLKTRPSFSMIETEIQKYRNATSK